MKRYLLLTITLLLALLLSGLGWLGLTESGLLWSYKLVQQQIPGALRFSALRGSLVGGVEVIDLDYRKDELQVSSDSFLIEWLPRHLLIGEIGIGRLALSNLVISLPPADDTDAAAKPAALELPEIVLPVSIDLQQFSIDGLELRQGEQHYRISRIAADMHARAQSLTIERLSLEAEGLHVSLNGQLDLAGHFQHQLAVEAEARLPSEDRVIGHASLVGDLRHSQLEAELNQPSQLKLSASVDDVLKELSWQLDMALTGFDSTQWRYPLPELAGGLQINAEGDLTTATLDGSAQVQRADTGPVDSKFRLQWGQAKVLELQSLIVDVKQAAMQLNAEGSWKPNDAMGEVDLKLAWQNLRWPIQGDERLFQSEKGTGQLSGQLEDYRFEVTSSSPHPQIPDSDWSLSGKGNAQSASFEQIVIQRDKASIKANGVVDWGTELSWQFAADGHAIDPALVASEWPGLLDFKLSHSGSFDEALAGKVAIETLNGELRGYPVELSGAMDIEGNNLDIQQIKFKSAGSTLDLSGRVDEALALDWSLQSERLAELLPKAKGQLQASGKIRGTREQPVLSVKLDGADLAYADYRAKELQGQVEIDPKKLESLRIDLVASSLELGAQLVQKLSVKGSGDGLKIDAAADDLEASVRFNGKASGHSWRGHLQQAELKLGATQQWRLVKPAALQVDEKGGKLEQTCLQGGEQGRVCVDLTAASGEWSSSTVLTALPLRLLRPWLPKDVDLDSVINADGQWRFQQGRLAGQLHGKLPAGKLSFPRTDGAIGQLDYRSGLAELVVDEQGIQSKLSWVLESGGHIDAGVKLPGAQLPGLEPEQQKIEGQIDLQLDDLSFAGVLLPEVDQLSGQAAASLKLSGRMASPIIDGNLSLDQGGFLLPRLGLNIRDLNLAAKSKGFDKMDFRLNAKSGEGELVVDGQLKQDAQGRWYSEMSVKGENFDVAQIPEAQVKASPDLNVRIEPNRIEVDGRVLIPHAHIEPRDISTAVSSSDDVVIIGEEQGQEPRWVIVSRVEVELGDRVHFFGFGFEGKLGGKLLVEEETGLPTRGTGEILITEGRYRAYGQRLSVEEGRLIFSGGPVAEPGLDIRSVREIEDITVGVRATGSVRKPQLELFSTPTMGQTDILSYLLLGRPLEATSDEEGQTMAKAALALGLSGGDQLARGLRDGFGLDEMRVESSADGDQASLVIGRYLSPRLYVSYGIGLIEAFNTFIVRYQISNNWQLKAESGEAYGADLIYSIER